MSPCFSHAPFAPRCEQTGHADRKAQIAFARTPPLSPCDPLTWFAMPPLPHTYTEWRDGYASRELWKLGGACLSRTPPFVLWLRGLGRQMLIKRKEGQCTCKVSRQEDSECEVSLMSYYCTLSVHPHCLLVLLWCNVCHAR